MAKLSAVECAAFLFPVAAVVKKEHSVFWNAESGTHNWQDYWQCSTSLHSIGQKGSAAVIEHADQNKLRGGKGLLDY